MPKISVIIPIYNVEQYIAQCLDSVIKQTYKDLEILCIDDCGQDNSMQIVEKYAQNDSRIKIVRHKVNKGLGEARNTGIDNATGDTIFFLDSDDYLNLDILEKLYNTMLKDKVDIVISKTLAFAEDENDTEISKRVSSLSKYLDYHPFSNYKVELSNFYEAYSMISCVAWGRLYSYKFIEKNALCFVHDNLIHEDNGFFLKLLSSCPSISGIESVGVNYLIRNNSITGVIRQKENEAKRELHLSKVLEDALDFIKNKYDAKTYKDVEYTVRHLPEYRFYYNKSYYGIVKVKYGSGGLKINILRLTIVKIIKQENIKIYKIFNLIPIKVKV